MLFTFDIDDMQSSKRCVPITDFNLNLKLDCFSNNCHSKDVAEVEPCLKGAIT